MKRKSVLPLLWPLFLVLLLAGVGVGGARAQDAPPPYDPDQVSIPAEPPLAVAGRTIYAESCAPCHGAGGLGDGPTAASLPVQPAAFAELETVWEQSPAELFHVTKFGNMQNMMPPWGQRLTDEQIWQAVAYAWGLHTDQAQVADGAALYAASCAGCHGESGTGDGPDAEASLVNFSDLSYAMKTSQAAWLAGWQAAHPEIGGDWDQTQQQTVLEYIRTFSYVPSWETGYREGEGVIRGQVRQGTEGGAPVDDAEVRLEAFVDFAPAATFTATVDAEGAFVFENLSTNPGVVYFASTTNNGITYRSPMLKLSADAPSTDATITVYETTDDLGGLRISRMHWIFDPRPGALLIGQVLTFDNEGDRTFVGRPVEGVDGVATVAIPLPANAQGVQLEGGTLGERYQQVGDLIYDTAPVLPGRSIRQIVVQYAVPYQGTELSMAQELRYPVDNLSLFAASLPDLSIEIPGLTAAGTQVMQGSEFQIFEGTSLEPQMLSVSVQGLLAPGSPDPRAAVQNNGAAGQAGFAQSGSTAVAAAMPLESWLPWTVGGALFTILAAAVVWNWRRSSSAPADDVQETLQQQQQDLVQRIARLDDLHALGEVDDEMWQAERSQLKAELLILRAREHSDTSVTD